MTDAHVAEPDLRPLWPRVAATLAAPRRLALYLRHHAPWFDALLLATLLAAAVAAAQPGELYLEQAEDPVSKRGTPVVLTSPPEQIVAWGRAITFLAALTTHPLLAFGLAGVLALVFTVLRGGSAAFRQYLALASHALLIFSLGAVLLLPVQWATGATSVAAAPGLLFPAADASPSLLVRTLAAVDVFTLWMLAVLAVGVAVLNGRRSWAAPAAALIGLYLVLLGVTASLPA